MFNALLRLLGNIFVHCECPAVCDCQDYDHGLVSEECPVHNDFPYCSPDCPRHGEEQGWLARILEDRQLIDYSRFS